MIREKSQKGKSAYAIGKELGISKNTVKKYVDKPKAVHGLKGKTKPVFCKPKFLTFAKLFPQAPVGDFYVNPSSHV